MYLHTPGPWSAGFRDNERKTVSSERDGLIALVGGGDSRDANARLVSAAPDLLEVVVAMARAIDQHLITNTTDNDSIGVISDAAQAAITKATGTGQ